MQTSYFAISHKLPNAISIAAKPASFFKGREYLPLAPTWRIYCDYQKSQDTQIYTREFIKEILDPLDPQQVFNELGKDSILLCWEAPDKFCHRRIIAKWLEDSLGIKVPEL
jgi:hypothetical protein